MFVGVVITHLEIRSSAVKFTKAAGMDYIPSIAGISSSLSLATNVSFPNNTAA